MVYEEQNVKLLKQINSMPEGPPPNAASLNLIPLTLLILQKPRGWSTEVEDHAYHGL